VCTYTTFSAEPGGDIIGAERLLVEASSEGVGICLSDSPPGQLCILSVGRGRVVNALVEDEPIRPGNMLQSSANGRLQKGTLNAVARAFDYNNGNRELIRVVIA